jgi:hypothetical protein
MWRRLHESGIPVNPIWSGLKSKAHQQICGGKAQG